MWDRRDTDVKNRLLGLVGEGEGGVIWDNSIETCILPSVKQITNTNLIHESGHPNLLLKDNPEGWDGIGGVLRILGHMYTHGLFMFMYGKNHYIIVK